MSALISALTEYLQISHTARLARGSRQAELWKVMDQYEQDHPAIFGIVNASVLGISREREPGERDEGHLRRCLELLILCDLEQPLVLALAEESFKAHPFTPEGFSKIILRFAGVELLALLNRDYDEIEALEASTP